MRIRQKIPSDNNERRKERNVILTVSLLKMKNHRIRKTLHSLALHMNNSLLMTKSKKKKKKKIFVR